jgi:hypothetical protein
MDPALDTSPPVNEYVERLMAIYPPVGMGTSERTRTDGANVA